MISLRRFFAFLIAIWLFPSAAFAFPGMIRHGYVHCISCHVSPTGGGVLTPYGRELSQEVLSMRSRDGEGQWAYGAFKDQIPELLSLGGDVRLIQTRKENSVYRENRFFLMQADFELAATFGDWVVAGTVGVYDQQALSLRHYLLYRRTDQNLFRLGRFMPAYGINTSEHTLTTRRDLGWDESRETYNFEASWLEDRWSAFVTLLLGRPESVSYEDGLSFGLTGYSEQGVALKGSRFFGEKYEIGLSYLWGSTSQADRQLAGPYWILGFAPHFYFQGELAFQSRTPVGRSNATGVFDSLRLDWEAMQGLHFYLLQELARPNFRDQFADTERYGAGLGLFPRPHWELDLRWYRQRTSLDGNGFGDLAWAMLHFYP